MVKTHLTFIQLKSHCEDEIPKFLYPAFFLPGTPAVTCCELLPIVGEGGGPFLLDERADGDNCAKPTLGGFDLKTEYTFLRKASPMIQLGRIVVSTERPRLSDNHCCDRRHNEHRQNWNEDRLQERVYRLGAEHGAR